jgi:hypothetical protein
VIALNVVIFVIIVISLVSQISLIIVSRLVLVISLIAMQFLIGILFDGCDRSDHCCIPDCCVCSGRCDILDLGPSVETGRDLNSILSNQLSTMTNTDFEGHTIHDM